MALKSIITNGVNDAFRLIGDLGETMTFTNTTSEEYNFDTGNVITTTTSPVTIKGIVLKQYKDITDNPRLLADITLKTADITAIELDNYDTLNFRSKDWKINSVEDNDFVTTVNVAREI